jgi:hypothetical protein
VTRPSVRRLAPPALLLLAALPVGCGNSRAKPPDVTTAQIPKAARQIALPKDGVAFFSPANWSITTGGQPYLVTSLTSGRAVLAVWRYPRVESLPADQASLRTARGRLIREAQKRDPTLKVSSSKLLKTRGVRAIELLGTETIDGQPRQLRSTHYFAFGSEFVLDAYAPNADFDRIDKTAFALILRTLKLSRPAAASD